MHSGDHHLYDMKYQSTISLFYFESFIQHTIYLSQTILSSFTQHTLYTYHTPYYQPSLPHVVYPWILPWWLTTTVTAAAAAAALLVPR